VDWAKGAIESGKYGRWRIWLKVNKDNCEVYKLGKRIEVNLVEIASCSSWVCFSLLILIFNVFSEGSFSVLRIKAYLFVG